MNPAPRSNWRIPRAVSACTKFLPDLYLRSVKWVTDVLSEVMVSV
jgi:hypothetical protein